MAINDILQEKMAAGEVDNAQEIMKQGRQRQQHTSLNPENIIQLEKTDAQLWIQFGILVMLVLIFMKL